MTNKNSYPDEERLLASVRSGESDSYRYIIETYQERIIRVCKGFVGSHEDAEDIAQDVFLQLFKSANKLRGEASLSTWLYRVAVNKSINFLRSVKSRNSLFSKDIEESVDASSGECTDDNITSSDHRKALRQAIDSLPDKQKTAFILQKYEELSYEEISKLMDLSLSSVQSLIFRAKQNLQDRLKEYFEKNFT